MNTTYTKSGNTFYKTISEDDSILVDIKNPVVIRITRTILTKGDDTEPSTQEEFEKAYNEVNNILRYAAMGISKEEEAQQKRIEAAGHYLCETTDDDGKEVSIADQIALIEAADDDEMLSEIENVLEWEAVQGRFSAREFLDLIG